MEICRQLDKKGVSTVLTSRDEEKGQSAVKNLTTKGAKSLIYHQLDLGSSESRTKLVEFVSKNYENYSIVLVNNAGILHFEV